MVEPEDDRLVPAMVRNSRYLQEPTNIQVRWGQSSTNGVRIHSKHVNDEFVRLVRKSKVMVVPEGGQELDDQSYRGAIDT